MKSTLWTARQFLWQVAALSTIGTFFCASPAQAQLVIEPLLNVVPGSGPGGADVPNFGFSAAGASSMPGRENAFAYVAGNPRDPDLDVVTVWNDTSYNLTSLWLEIIGTGTDTKDPSTIVRGAPFDAVFGDVDGDGMILSDIFPQIVISNDGHTIQFTGGVIPPGGRFTDVHLAVSPLNPDYVGIDSWFEGELVPEPSSAVLGLIGGMSLFAGRKRRAALRLS